MIKRVQGLLRLNLYKLLDDNFKGLGELLGDPIQLIDVLYCRCKDEADAKKVSDEDFGRALGEDAITLAFLEKIMTFFLLRRAKIL